MKHSDKNTQLVIKGMHCGSCVNKVTAALNPFAEKVSVSLNPPIANLKNSTATIAQINKTLSLIGDYKASKLIIAEITDAPTENKSWLSTYKPLFLIVGYILITTLAIDLTKQSFNAESWMMHFMAGFFLVFSFFKMLNIHAFASSYAMYDLLAMRSKAYGFFYPFIELTLGMAYLLAFEPKITNTATLFIMGF